VVEHTLKAPAEVPPELAHQARADVEPAAHLGAGHLGVIVIEALGDRVLDANEHLSKVVVLEDI
jgi:hypothetical protein